MLILTAIVWLGENDDDQYLALEMLLLLSGIIYLLIKKPTQLHI